MTQASTTSLLSEDVVVGFEAFVALEELFVGEEAAVAVDSP